MTSSTRQNEGGSTTDVHTDTPHRRLPEWGFHLIGAALAIATTIAFLLTLFVIGFSLTYCNSAPPAATEVWTGRGGVLLAGMVWASIPAVTGIIARRTERHAMTWFVVAAIAAGLALVIAPLMGPSEWCLF